MEVVVVSENVLGKRMRWLRDKKDLKQNRVASALGVTPYQLSRYESGKSKPDPELITDIADYYNVTTDYLMGRTESTEYEKEDDKSKIINKIATEFPDADLMFNDLANMTAEQLEDVYDYIKFKQRKKDK